MSQKEREKFASAAKLYQKKVLRSKKASRKFLIELGVFTEAGNVRKQYKGICIPQGQV
jgi:hypothetical protein